MPAPKTPGRWPYRAQAPGRRLRVVRGRDGGARGVRAQTAPEPRWRLTPKQARIALAGAAAMMVLSAAWWTYHSPWLTVSDVKVVGAHDLSAQQVKDAAAVSGDSIFGLDLGPAQARVAALPKVRSATVKKDGVHGVEIDVQERTAWGVWRINGVDTPIDEDGYVLDGAPPPGLPVIAEIDPLKPVKPGDVLDQGAVRLAVRIEHDAQASFGRTVRAFIYQHDQGLSAVLNGPSVDDKPIWVTFGDGQNYDYKVAALYVLFQRAEKDDLALSVVDLRFGDRLSFR